MHQKFSRVAASGLALVAAAVSAELHAQTATGADAGTELSAPLSEVTVTGSRFGARMAVDSPTPIDSISAEALTRGGASDLQGMLKVAVPSFSTPRPTAAGPLDFLTPPTLRGLSTGQLLLLVNGKRRHTSSILNTGNQVGRGDVAYDFNAVPSAAVKRVEVLRDGAAAQYGSDAIAGVMNIVLDDTVGFTVRGKVGETSEHDGEHMEASAGAGFALGENGGVVRVTAQYQHHDQTNRATPDTRQQYFGSNGTRAPSANYGSGTGITPANGTLDPREATIDRNVFVSGEPAYEMGSAFVNLELPVSEHATVYSFGGYSRLDGTSFNFFRRAGQDETVRALWPDGYLPLQDIELQNFSAAAGVRGDGLAGFNWDFSSVYGGSIDDLGYDDSNNVSLGAASPLSFDRGGSRFKQWTTNLDLTREFAVGAMSPLKLALGLEYRKEFYELVAGDPASYTNGMIPILDGPNAGRPAPVGGQPSGGLSPSEALSVNRDSKAAYVEVEQELFEDRLLLSGALRSEKYSDFGDTTNYKAATRFRIVDGLSLRGSYGTGFRAPNLAQSYNTSSGISFVNGAPLRIRQIGVNDPMAPLVGASELKPEESKNLSLGIVFDTRALTASLDVYRIKVTDRIALSSNFQSTALTNLLAANGFPGIAAVSFETNAVDTTTKGVDLTVTYAHDFGAAGQLRATLAGNYNESDFDRISGTPAPLAALGITAPLFDLTQQVRFTNSMPEDKIALSLDWKYRAFSVNLTNTRYGEVAQVSLTGRTPAQVAALIPGYDVRLVSSGAGTNQDIIQYFGADIVTDLEVGYDVNERFSVSAGASNLFDQYPDEQIASTAASVAAGTNGADNTGTLPYAYIAPYGFSGRFFYFKSVFRF